MATFSKYIAQFRVQDDEKPHNFRKMEGGKMYVPIDRLDEFWKTYALAGAQLPLGRSLVPVCQNLIGPMAIDIDLSLAHAEGDGLTLTHVWKFLECVMAEFDPDTRYETCITKKDTPFYVKRLGGVDVFQTGFHLFVMGEFTNDDCVLFRQRNLALIGQVFGDLPLAVELDKIWDEGVTRRSKYPMVIGSSKPKKDGDTGGRAKPIFFGEFVNGNCATGFQGDKLDTLLEDQKWMQQLLGKLYGGLAGAEDPTTGLLLDMPRLDAPESMEIDEQKGEPDVVQPGAQSKEGSVASSCSSPRRLMPENEDYFSLEGFLSQTPGVEWRFPEWTKIIPYIACCGLSATQVQAELNRAWNWSGNEIGKLMEKVQRNYNPLKRPHKHTVLKIMRSRAPNLDESKIWTTQKVQPGFYAEYKRFTEKNGPQEEGDIMEFLARAISFTAYEGKFLYRMRFKRKNKKGEVFINTVLKLETALPWCGNDCFDVLLIPPPRFYLEKARSTLNDDGFRDFNRQLTACKTGEQARVLAATVKIRIPNQSTPMKKLVQHAHSKCIIPRFDRLVNEPYLRIDPSGEDEYNCFTGFPLIDYVPKKKVDIKKTMVWRLLLEVWCHGKMHLFNSLVDRIAWKTQNPGRKSKRAYISKSTKHGTGKTSLFHFLKAMWGANHCIFELNLKKLFQNFNLYQANALLIWCDDIDNSSNKQTGDLKARISADEMVFEAKGQKPISLQDTAEYWMTSNCEVPLYTEKECRRQLVIECSASWKNAEGRKCFNKLYEEFRSLDTMKAWFDHLTSRDVSQHSNFPEDDPQEWSQTKEVQKLKCMKMPFKFIAEFFADEEWPWRYIKQTEHADERLAKVAICVLKTNTAKHSQGTVRILIERKELYELYKRFQHREYPSSKNPMNKDSFWSSLKELDIIPQDRVLFPNGKRPSKSVQIFQSDVAKGFHNAGYKKLPDDLDNWPTEDDEMRRVMQIEIKTRIRGYMFVGDSDQEPTEKKSKKGKKKGKKKSKQRKLAVV